MVIRQEQMQAFREDRVTAFEQHVFTHVNTHFPREAQALGEAPLRELIREGRKRASTYGFSLQSEICKFIDLMVLFGRGFDSDPNLPWAAATLQDPSLSAPSPKMAVLWERARNHRRVQQSMAI